jgi:2-furoyl-CoA dehydrogenase large subunit
MRAWFRQPAPVYHLGTMSGTTTRPPVAPPRAEPWVGRGLQRVEDEALLRGRGWFMDDLDPLPNTAHAAILRSTAAHARIASLDVSGALEVDGVLGVLTPDDVRELSRPFPSALGDGIPFYDAAVDRVSYVGEPVFVVLARYRYVAEEAMERICGE